MLFSHLFQFSVGETRASLILQEGHDSFDLLNQIKRIYDYGHSLIGKDISTTPIQTRMNHFVSALINHDIFIYLILTNIIGLQ